MKPTTRSSLLAALVLLVLAGPAAAHPQGGARQLAEAVVEAIQEQDGQALLEMVHPDVVAYFEENYPGRLNLMVGAWLRRQIPDRYDVQVRLAREVDEYDPSTKIITVGGMRLQFSIAAPSHFITVTGERANPGGRGQPVGQGFAEAAARHRGRYYLVVPLPVR